MRASVGLFVIVIPIAGAFAATTPARPDAPLTATDEPTSDEASPPEETRARSELAAPPRWTRVREGAATIPADHQVGGPLCLRYFDVKDLAVAIHQTLEIHFLTVTDVFLSPSNHTPSEPPELPEEALIFPSDPLVDTIKSVVDPESWALEGVSLEVANGTLIVKNTPATIEHVGRLLDELRANGRPPADVERPPPPAEPLHLWDRAWSVEDLVGDAAGDGSVSGDADGASRPPYAPAALLAVLRTRVGDDRWTGPDVKISLAHGTLRAHLDTDSIDEIERLLGEFRARSGTTSSTRTTYRDIATR